MDDDFDEIPQDIIDDMIELKPKKKEVNPVSKAALATYYQDLFPYETFFRWLGKGSSEYFERREFSFTLEGDRYVRFQCFKTHNELKETILRGQPIKIDIGAVYNTLPKLHGQIDSEKQFLPIEKELVFDIDMTDYDDIRTCCQEAKICDKCWKYMVVAYLVLKKVFYDDFGFEKVMWIFSGRRGIHCWISDDIARKLTNEGRSAVVNFIKYSIGNTKTGIVQGLKEPIHPSIERAIEIIERVFEEYILIGQDLLNNSKGKELMKGLIKAYFNQRIGCDEFIAASITSILERRGSSKAKMDEIQRALETFEDSVKTKRVTKYKVCQLIVKDFKLNVLYPRLDINVSKHLNHLLKSPFCIHPKTGMVSVPMSESDILKFEVSKIPTLDAIVKDFDAKVENKQYEHFKQIFKEYSERCDTLPK